MPEAVLARRVRGRGAARGSAIYAAVAPATLTLIRRLVGSARLAEDLFQDTMMILFERLPQFRREAPLGAWLRQIAISRCLMYLRSPWRRALTVPRERRRRRGRPRTPRRSRPVPRRGHRPRARAGGAAADRARGGVDVRGRGLFASRKSPRAFGRSVSFSKSQLARAHVRLRAWLEPQENRPSCTLI